MVSALAGWTSDLFSEANAAAVYWVSIKPELRPPSRVRKVRQDVAVARAIDQAAAGAPRCCPSSVMPSAR